MDSQPRGTNKGAIAAIIFFIVLFAVAIGFGVWWYIKHRSTASGSSLTSPVDPTKSICYTGGTQGGNKLTGNPNYVKLAGKPISQWTADDRNTAIWIINVNGTLWDGSLIGTSPAAAGAALYSNELLAALVSAIC